jgi:sugar/nucleoside kinase (ribokinase family)
MEEKSLDICGLGTGLVDVLIHVSNEELAALGLAKGSTVHVDSRAQGEILRRLAGKDAVLSGGGSTANSIFLAAGLGSRTAFMTRLADDSHGRLFKSELDEQGIHLPAPLAQEGATGTCICLIAPDAERTLSTDLGVSALISEEEVREEIVARSRWLLLEGYLLAGGEKGLHAARRAVELAGSHGTLVALGLSALSIVRRFTSGLCELAELTDLVFGSEDEALELTGARSVWEAAAALGKSRLGAVVTSGAQGAYVRFGGARAHACAFPCTPVDSTGAGDAFAGAFLHGICRGLAPEIAARCASFLAMKVTEQEGARLRGDVKALWEQALPGDPRQPE